MLRTHTLVIGGGQAGLAMSRCLSDRGVDHVVLERGRVGERWRSERWDSLRTLTPRWQSRLPGLVVDHADADGYMTMPEVVAILERYAASCAAPVITGAEVTSVVPAGGSFEVRSTRGDFLAHNVVIATGHCDVPNVPRFASSLPASVVQVTPSTYRRPSDLPEGGVLVVGASASGVQIAEELHLSGRPVTLAVGTHTRMPRTYRGRDVMWWLDALGVLDDPTDPTQPRRLPSLQLAGRREPALDLGTLAARGVRVVGRVLDVSGRRVRLGGDLVGAMACADTKLGRLLDRIDGFVDMWGLARVVEAPDRPPPIALPAGPGEIDLRRDRIATVVWATGYRRRYPWLRVPVLDARGEIIHAGGVTRHPGLYVLGLQMLRRRSSSFLDGVGKDAVVLADHIADRSGCDSRRAA